MYKRQDSDSDDGMGAVQDALESQLPQIAPNFTMKSGPVPFNGAFAPDEEQAQELLEQVSKALSEETARIAAHRTETVSYTHLVCCRSCAPALCNFPQSCTSVARGGSLRSVA